MLNIKGIETAGLLLLTQMAIGIIPFIISIFLINYGRLLHFLYRVVSPIVAIGAIAYTAPAPFGGLQVKASTVIGLFHPMEVTALWSGAYLVVWSITSYLHIGPPQWFVLLAQAQYKTTLKRRRHEGATWVNRVEEKAIIRREQVGRLLHIKSANTSTTQVHEQSVHEPDNPVVWNENMTGDEIFDALFRSQKRNPDFWGVGHDGNRANAQSEPIRPFNNEEEKRRQHEEDNLANGRVNWRPLGKQYQANPNAYQNIFGMEDVLKEIQQSIENLLLNPRLVAEYDVSLNAGLLLYGPPGTGKTELARAVAKRLGVYFIAVRPSDLLGTLIGSTEQNIANLFKEARDNTPSIIFIDEIDAIGSKRGTAHTYHDQTLTQLLTELDGFDHRSGVFVIAATNRLDALDEALTRGGRFGTKIEVPLPNDMAIANMFGTWASVLHFTDNVYNYEVAIAMRGHSGADVKALVERLKHVEISKRVSGELPLITRDEVFAEMQKIIG